MLSPSFLQSLHLVSASASLPHRRAQRTPPARTDERSTNQLCLTPLSMIIERQSWSQGNDFYIRPDITFKDGVHPPPHSPRIPVIHSRPIYHLFLQRV
ncbi:hypothetical protein GYMLUDRAFT_691261 [Collybiopsis luxurians FD-317 M1]|uniref:Unplaced genomic scaffold GYMLUscaffold_36, whole genome shotgun sequence n=1 Tax=Collybiopsis luxurians FD-317 M1 TaxID=944289 RepID=A0A0D0BT38_9AGAR|nr:hypothetical protein GYMLUDRAFT_691261 [Collybiopsis luxurians FD-317 M1]